MVDTLADMKTRIADELARSDLASQIANAIGDAIKAYQKVRFFFNESRSACTFNTVATQQDYAAADNANIPNLLAIDYVALTVGSTVTMLDRYEPEVIEDLSNNQSAVGEPYAYTYYNRLMRLYPIPGQAYAVRVAAHIKLAAPASDSEADNAWMVEAETLIRSRAKRELATHVLHDPEMAAALVAPELEALSELKGQTNRQTGTGRVAPTQF